MKRKKGLIFLFLGSSIGYLIYSYLFIDYGLGIMKHHYGYYDDYSRIMFYSNGCMVIISYTVIVVSTIILLSYKIVPKTYSMALLDERLLKGEISVDDCQKLKRVINRK